MKYGKPPDGTHWCLTCDGFGYRWLANGLGILPCPECESKGYVVDEMEPANPNLTD